MMQLRCACTISFWRMAPLLAVFLFSVVACVGGTPFPQLLSAPSVDCQTDGNNFCRAMCDSNVLLDISEVFEYPVTARAEGYDYVYTPCSGGYCALVEGPVAALCQVYLNSTDTLNYTCGLIDKVEWKLLQNDPYVFTLTYTEGSDNRVTIITFHEEPTLQETQFVFSNEEPENTYHLDVKGKYVGQPRNINEKCIVDDTNLCVATCAGQRIDISSVFQYPTKTQAGNFTYTYSPCGGGAKCGDTESSAMCQSSPNFSYSVGSASSVEWWVNQTAPNYVFTIEYKLGDSGRMSRVKYVEDLKMLSTIFVFTTESRPLEYDFEVRGHDIGLNGGGSDCSGDPLNPCVLYCNGSLAVDVSDVFKYPVSTKYGDYIFDYNPCIGSLCGCPNRHPGAAVCQSLSSIPPPSGYYYNCGQISNITWTLTRAHPYVFSIEYGNGDNISCDNNDGDGNRKSVITFYEDPAATGTTNYTFLQESPKLDYHFEVRGSYVGQTVNKTGCAVDPRTPCVATCNRTVKIDLSKVFPNPITIFGPGDETFIFSPCVGYSCGFPAKNSSVCLSGRYSCGLVNTVKWTLTQEKPFLIYTLTYIGGDNSGSGQRHSTVTFVENSEVSRIVAVFAGELSGGSYLFDVVGSCVGQQSCTGKSREIFHLIAGAPLVVVFVAVLILVVVAVAGVGLSGKRRFSTKRKEVPLLKQ